jgi:hypothetical protein
MNDDDLITTVRESFTGVHSTTPVEQIVKRSRAVRARQRLIPGGAGALAVVAGAAVAMTALTPASHQATAQPPAWTVAKLADGNISVRILQMVDPARLQRVLRADGVPATVTFPRHLNPACRPYPASKAQLRMVFLPRPGPRPSHSHPVRPVHRRGVWPPRPTIAFILDPSALPAGTGVRIAVPHVQLRPITITVRPGQKLPKLPKPHYPPGLLDLVYASQACTGS